MHAERKIAGEGKPTKVTAIDGKSIGDEGEQVAGGVRSGKAAAERERRLRCREQIAVAAGGLRRQRQRGSKDGSERGH